jgi:hypothetical protein
MFVRQHFAVFLITLSLTNALLAINPLKDLLVHRQYVKKALRHRYQAMGMQQRAEAKTETITYDATGPDTTPGAPSPTQNTTYTLITPSLGADPIPITQQSQVITSFVPQYTLCPLGISASNGPRYTNSSRSPVTLTSSGKSMSTWNSGQCSTGYNPTLTTVCHTVLQGIATAATVTNCSQQITFSTDKNYTQDSTTTTVSQVGTFTLTTSIRLLTTYFAAPWQALVTPGAVPSRVNVRICSTNANGDQVCVNYVEMWKLSTITMQMGEIQHVTIEKTMSGPSALLIETLRTDITAVRTLVSVDTTVGVFRPYETVTLLRNATDTNQGPTTRTVTVTTTRSVELASSMTFGQAMPTGTTEDHTENTRGL